MLIYLLNDPRIVTSLVFTRTKHGADRVTKDLIRAGVKAEAIHGDKSQNARQRALANFKAKLTRVLVATDIAARGIDVDDLSHVINFEIPNTPETYVHRIGRTGRAGLSGIAISFCDNEERAYVKDITKLIGKQIPIVEEHPFKMGTPVPPREHSPRRPQGNGNNRPVGKDGQNRNRSGKPKQKSTHPSVAGQKSHGSEKADLKILRILYVGI